MYCMFRDCIIGRYIAREYIVDVKEQLQLFVGAIIDYNIQTKLFLVKYPADNTQEWYPAAEVM